MTMDWEQFLDPYIQAVGELKIKLRGIRKQFRKQNRHSPIEFVTGRVKSVASIEEKIALRGLSIENLAKSYGERDVFHQLHTSHTAHAFKFAIDLNRNA